MAEYHVGALQEYSTIQAAMNAALAAGDIVTIHGGIYNEFIVSKAASVTVRGATCETVIIDGTGQAQETVRLTHSNTALKNVRVIGPADKYNIRFYTGTGFLFEDVYFDVRYRFAEAYKGAMFNRCLFIGNTKLENNINSPSLPVTESIVFNFCIVISNRWADLRGGTIEHNHCIFLGSAGRMLYVFPNTAIKTLRINNCVFSCCNLVDYSDSVIKNASTGNEVVEIGGTSVVASLMNATAPFVLGAYTDLGGNNFGTAYPGLRDLGYDAFVSVEVDDAVNAPTFLTLASKLESYGWRGTWQIDTANISDWDAVRALYAKGHEIASHTRRHVNLSNMAAFTIRHNSLPCTMSIDTTAMLLTTSQGLSLDLTQYANIGALAAAINGDANYTAVSTGSLPTAYSQAGIPSCLADVADVDIRTATYTANYDRTKLYTEEVDGSLVDLSSNIPNFVIANATLCSPGHYIDADGEQYIYENGWLGARKGTNNESLSDGNLDFFHVYGVQPSLITTSMRRDLMKHIERARFDGRVLCIYFHGISSGEWPNGWDDVDLFLSELKKSGATVLPRRDALLLIKQTATQTGRTYAQAPRERDLRINPSSKLVHAGSVITGVNDGAQTDPWDNKMLARPNIGADQYDYAPGFGPWSPFDATMPTLSLAATCPGSLLEVQEWSKVATAKEIEKNKP